MIRRKVEANNNNNNSNDNNDNDHEDESLLTTTNIATAATNSINGRNAPSPSTTTTTTTRWKVCVVIITIVLLIRKDALFTRQEVDEADDYEANDIIQTTTNQQQQQQQQRSNNINDDGNDDSNNVLLSLLPTIDSSPILKYLDNELSSHYYNKEEEEEDEELGDMKEYQRLYCNLENKREYDYDWWMGNGQEDYVKRMPAFMIIGVKKAGTTSFHSSLTRHPHIISAKRKELLFFSQKKFNFTYYTGNTFNTTNVTQHYHINVPKVRPDLLQEFPSRENFINNPSIISLDATPQYIHNFATSARTILCTCPWIKILLIVRNPTDRLWSHYNFVHQYHILAVQKKRESLKAQQQQQQQQQAAPPFVSPPFVSFEKWIQQDLERLMKLGLLQQQSKTTQTKSTSDKLLSESDVLQSWFDYVQEYVEGPIGRGFYGLAIHQWFKEVTKLGRRPKDVFKIVRLEDLSNDTPESAKIMNGIIEWLGLSTDVFDYTKKKLDKENDAHNGGGGGGGGGDSPFVHKMVTNMTTLGKPVLSEATRQLLDKLYEPHMEQLSRLLGDERWKYDRSDTSSSLVWP